MAKSKIKKIAEDKVEVVNNNDLSCSALPPIDVKGDLEKEIIDLKGELLELKNKDNFKDMLANEESDLKYNIEKLYDFTQSENFKCVSNIQKQLLKIQLDSMRTYWRCLITRINDLNSL